MDFRMGLGAQDQAYIYGEEQEDAAELLLSGEDDAAELFMSEEPDELLMGQTEIRMFPVDYRLAFPPPPGGQRRRPCRRRGGRGTASRHVAGGPGQQPEAEANSSLAAVFFAGAPGIGPLLSAVRASSLPPRTEAAAELQAFSRRGGLAAVAAVQAAAELQAGFEVGQGFEADLPWQPMPWGSPGGPVRRRRRRRAKGCLQLVCSCSTAGLLQTPTGDKCTICLEEMNVGQEIRTLPCFHMLHKTCAMKYFSTGGVAPNCPICRAHVRQGAARPV